jgi:hypothetical protein
MTVRVRLALGLAAVLALQGEPARAQYGWPVGRYGFGGWGATPQGDIARGAGALAAGAGQYNAQTAAANSVNADTAMRLNQYLYLSQQESNRRQYERQALRQGKTKAAAAGTADRLRNKPEPADIDRGDALNVLLDDLTDPSLLHASALRLAGSEIDAELVRTIPFRNAAEAVTIGIDQLTDPARFPELLRSNALSAEREAFIAAVREARRQAHEQGEITPAAVNAVQSAGRALYDKAKSPQIVATPTDRNAALNYLKGMAALAKILENPDTLQALKDLKEVKTTHVANLIAFMHTYNLRFGPAESAAERKAYQTLYPILRGDRDRITSAPPPPAGTQASAPPPPPDPRSNPTEIFQAIDEKHLNLPAGDK